ncbi:hypothetical protein [Paenibacillus wynnii]|uniref:hypothetical protein n=1 Tax=Paenibacillus wynnii TaxID=268407 RepID=UPI002793C7CD|nr:hypothetical protein [Paenibacillus wynnii]MDQ0192937.1 hypothetical protein [Paenibacillus wynnii]
MKDSDKNFMGTNGFKTYLTGQGTPGEREKWEDILLEDEEALSLYMESLDELQDEIPELVDQGSFVNRVIEGLQVTDKIIGPQRLTRKRWYERTLFHYAVAASLTLLFMSSGVFDRLMTGNMDVVVQNDNGGLSYSEQVMQATSGWLEQLMTDGNQ